MQEQRCLCREKTSFLARLPTPPYQTKTEEVSSAQGTAPKISFSTSTFLFFRSPLPKCALSPDFAIFPYPYRTIPIASTLPKSQALVFRASQPRCKPTLTKSRSLISCGERPMPARSVSFMCLLRHVSSALSRNYRNEPRPDVDEAWFVTVKFMAPQLHGLGDVNTKYRIARELLGRRPKRWE